MLAPGGQVVFIVPNRSGLWARRDVTPFGFGRPYSFGQLEALAAPAPLRARAPRRRALRAAVAPAVLAADRAASGSGSAAASIPRLVAGALLMEATKQVYARPNAGPKVAVPGPLEVLGRPRRQPKPEPSPVAAAARWVPHR